MKDQQVLDAREREEVEEPRAAYEPPVVEDYGQIHEVTKGTRPQGKADIPLGRGTEGNPGQGPQSGSLD